MLELFGFDGLERVDALAYASLARELADRTARVESARAAARHDARRVAIRIAALTPKK